VLNSPTHRIAARRALGTFRTRISMTNLKFETSHGIELRANSASTIYFIPESPANHGHPTASALPAPFQAPLRRWRVPQLIRCHTGIAVPA
jgi:hypothetical protein